MLARILIADPDESFGLMLKQILEVNGEYSVESYVTGAAALTGAQRRRPDLAIVDAALTDMSPAALITSLQLIRPGIAVMLIPLGGNLPDEYQRLGVRGILTKPFYVGNLEKFIGEVLGPDFRASSASGRTGQTGVLPLSKADLPSPLPSSVPQPANEAPPAPRPVEPPPMPRRPQTRPLPPAAERPREPEPPPPAALQPRVRQSIAPARRTVPSSSDSYAAGGTSPDVQAAVEKAWATLTHEVRADALFILRDGALLTQRGSLPPLSSERVAEVLKRWTAAATDLAMLVGEQAGRFAQFHAEGDRYHVYAFDTGLNLTLVVICRTDVPFGTLRLHLKSTGAQLAKLLQ